MLKIEDLSKESVYNVMSGLLYSLNYGWFLLEDFMRAKHPELLKDEDYLKVNENVGSYEAKRLSKSLDISGDSVDNLMHLVKYSHWAVFENIEIKKLTETSFRMRTIGCSAQGAIHKWGLEHYDCRLAGLQLRQGFFNGANKNAEVERIFSPPEARREGIPDNVSCEWLISLK